MSRLNQHIKAAIPNAVRRACSHALRPLGAPKRLKSFLAFDGDFSLPLGDRRIRFEYANRWIERELFWHGWKGYEPVSVDLWRRLVPGCRTILDIGANNGLFALVAKVMEPASTVFAFEPLPSFADTLERNARLNDADVRVVRAAVSDTDGRANFYVPQEYAGNIYSSTLSLSHYGLHQQSDARVLDVEVVRFDAFATRENIRDVDLVKIDAEGHDAMVIEGMREVIVRDHPDFLVEIQDDVIGARMMPFFDRRRYAFYNLSETHGARRAVGLGRSQTVNFLVCKHETAARLQLPTGS